MIVLQTGTTTIYKQQYKQTTITVVKDAYINALKAPDHLFDSVLFSFASVSSLSWRNSG